MLMTQITVRDGRMGRDPSRVTDEGGEVLHSFEMPYDPGKWPDVGDRLTLPSGEEVEVIGVKENMRGNEQNQITEHLMTLIVGNAFDVRGDDLPE